MRLNKQLESELDWLQKEKICDAETATALKETDNEAVRDLAFKVNEAYKRQTSPEEINANGLDQNDISNIKYETGAKLLFLEELLTEPNDTVNQVTGWLSDSKMSFLFTHSPQGELYGRLLLAKAGGNLRTFRADYSQLGEHTFYEYGTQIEVRVKELIDPNAVKSLIDSKLKIVIGAIESRYVEDQFGKLDKFSENLQRLLADKENRPRKVSGQVAKEFLDSKGVNVDEIRRIADKHEVGFGLGYKDVYSILSEGDEICGDDEAYGGMSPELTLTPFYEKVDEIQDAIERYVEGLPAMLGEIVSLFESVYKNGLNDESRKKFENITEELPLSDSNKSELTSLLEEAGNVKDVHKLSDRVRAGKTMRYSLKLSGKDPLDVRFGNDGGCCIGIYESDEGGIGNAYGLPQMIADNATLIFNVYEQIGTSKPHRVGIVLAFDAVDDKGNKVLACNSLELSPSMNPPDALADIVGYVESGLIDFGKKNGYAAVVMSNHDYNTSRNYSARSSELLSEQKLKKVNGRRDREFYSEIVGEGGTIEGTFYKLFDGRKAA